MEGGIICATGILIMPKTPKSSAIKDLATNLANLIKVKETVDWFVNMGIATEDVRYYTVAIRLIEIHKGE